MTELDVVKLLLDKKKPDEIVRVLREKGYLEADVLERLKMYLLDDAISEVMINGTDSVYIEKRGELYKLDWRFEKSQKIVDMVILLIGTLGKRLDYEHPMVDARIEYGRLNAVISPVSLNGPIVTIRKFIRRMNCIDELLLCGSLSGEIAAFLKKAVEAKQNIIISGGTSTGKTTLINVLAHFIGNEERIVTIEDVAELTINKPHVIRLEAREANTENRGRINIRDLFRNSLRMRPDRIIIGECRGGEAFDMLQAMNSGHVGSMTTLHANSPQDAVRRLEFLISLANKILDPKLLRQQIASAVDLVIQLERLKNGTRIVSYVQELSSVEGENICFKLLYWYDKIKRGFCESGMRAKFNA